MTPDQINAAADILFGTAKMLMARDKRLTPIAVIISADANMDCIELQFNTDREKRAAYRRVWELAASRNALAVITINDLYLKVVPVDERLEDYLHADLSTDPQAIEAITMVVMGPALQPRAVNLPYRRVGGEIAFDDHPMNTDSFEMYTLEPWWQEYIV